MKEDCDAKNESCNVENELNVRSSSSKATLFFLELDGWLAGL